MCLSTVYKGDKKPENIIMKNVMQIDCKDDMVVLTDLMDRQTAIQGHILQANLVDGFVLIQPVS